MSNINLKKIKNQIITEINEIIKKDIIKTSDLTTPPDSKMGDLSLACFDIAKILQKNPVETAKWLSQEYNQEKHSFLVDIKIIGPYLNFFLNKEEIIKNTLQEISLTKNKYGHNEALKNKKIIIEYAHPNPFKSFHIGHLRNTILGESICKLLETQGAKIIRTNYQGDVGMHIAKCLWAFQKIDSKEYPQTSDEKVALISKCYSTGAKAFESDLDIKKEITKINKKIYSREDQEINQLWEIGKKWSMDKFHKIFDRLGTKFDKEYMESKMIADSLKYIEQAQTKGILEKSDGAIVFKGNKYNLDTRVFLNSEGLPTYEGKELGLAYREFSDFGEIDLCIHNVAIEQISFFKVTFKVQELLDKKKFKNKQYHNAYEFVGLKKGKMSSRKGKVVLGNKILNQAEEKIAEIIKSKKELKNTKELANVIGIGAIKYSFLKISPFKYLAFDMNESINFSGDSGPYLQYTFVRIQSILKKTTLNINSQDTIDYKNLKEAKEYDLVLKLAKYPEIVEKSALNYDPSEIAKYLFELAQIFNDYYHHTQILKAEEKTRDARLFLLNSIAQVIQNGLSLLGIETVEEM